jgi:WD40 repeat protein/biotin carboxyl carrier protein
MLRRILSPALIGVAALWAVGCEPTLPPNPKTNGTAKAAEPARMSAADIGAPLYAPKPVPEHPATADTGGLPYDEFVVRNCQVTVPVTQNVPSKNDGKLVDYCTNFDPTREKVPESQIVVHPRTGVKYRRLKVGEQVQSGQLIAIMDDAVPFANYAIAEAKLKANIEKAEADKQIEKVAEEEYKMVKGLVESKSAPLSELRRNQAQWDRAKADYAEAVGLIGQSTEEKNKADITLKEHEIKSDIAGEFKRLYRRAGESIKAYDPVAEIQNMKQLRVEGMVSVERVILAQNLQLGQNAKVVVERAEQIAHERSLEGHMGAVRAVAVSKDPRKPLIVSASDDKTVGVWDRLTRRQVGHWPHDVAVRAVACTPKEADADLCLTGADDGVARLWDMTNPAAVKPLREMKGRHQQQIVFAAFAPNGQSAATADSREIIVWNVADGEMRYRIANPHNGAVTSIQFTPQSTLVTCGQDRTIRVWELGEKGAAPKATIEYRTGQVPVLGVSSDGQNVLFDRDQALHVLALADQRAEGVPLHAPSETAKFGAFALFSPDNRLILAGGTGDNPPQIWRAPANGSRGTILRRLAVGPGSEPTCAAFAPDGSFAVTGTQDGKVLVWGVPSDKEIKREITAKIGWVSRSIESSKGMVPIYAEDLEIPDGVKLFAGETVTLVITPQGSK